MGRAPRPGQPEWTAADTALAVALHRIESRACPGCGLDRTETMNPANEFAFEALAYRCHGCAARSRASEAHREAGGNTHGLLLAVTRREEH